jgi:hypothetical protein
VLIAIAALFARSTGAIAHSPYKMPLDETADQDS